MDVTERKVIAVEAIVVAAVVATALLLQLLVGSFPVEVFAFPLNVIILALWVFVAYMLHTNREKFMKVYNVYETFYIMATFAIYTLMAVFLMPLIEIYTGGINDANYKNAYLLILFVIMNLLANGKLPSNHVLEFSGSFRDTRSHAIWEMTINIVVSVVAILKWGICGAIVGTIVALLYRGSVMIYYANKKVLGRSVMKTYKIWLVNGIVFLGVMAVLFVDSFSGLSFGALLVKGLIYAPLIAIVYIVANFIFCPKVFLGLKGNKRI